MSEVIVVIGAGQIGQAGSAICFQGLSANDPNTCSAAMPAREGG
jgi:hypothetical protein